MEIRIGEFGIFVETFSDSRPTSLVRDTVKLMCIVPEIAWVSLNTINIKRSDCIPEKYRA